MEYQGSNSGLHPSADTALLPLAASKPCWGTVPGPGIVPKGYFRAFLHHCWLSWAHTTAALGNITCHFRSKQGCLKSSSYTMSITHDYISLDYGGIHQAFIFSELSDILRSHNHRITMVGKDLQDHPVQPSPLFPTSSHCWHFLMGFVPQNE